MTATNKLALELLQNAAANQTLANTTFARLNQLVQASVLDKDLSAPPASPADEALYIVSAGATGLWAGHDGQLAFWLATAGAWQFVSPREGFFVHVNDEDVFYKFTGAAWEVFSGGGSGGGMTNPMTAIRDLIVGGVGGAPTRLPGPTSEGLVLTRVGNALAWAIATGFANPMTAAGDIIIGATSGAAARLGAGADGQVLTIVSGAPAWVTPSGGSGSDPTKLPLTGGRMLGPINESTFVQCPTAAGSPIPDSVVSASNNLYVYGSGSIPSLAEMPEGSKRKLFFFTTCLLYNSASLLLLTGANITAAAGDWCEFTSMGTSGWRMSGYARGDGTPLVALPDPNKVDKVSGKGLSTEDYTTTEKTKLAGIGAGANVTSVAGKTGVVTLAKADVGLGSVDNTADSAKPVSGPQQTALDAKLDANNPTATGTLSVASGAASPMQMVGGLGGVLRHTKTAAGGQFDIDDVPFSATDPAQFRFHRNTTTSGAVTVTYYRGNGTTNIDHVFASAGTNAATTSEARLSTGGGKCVIGATASDATAMLLVNGPVRSNGPVMLGQYTLTTLPSASVFNGYLIRVTNATGGSKTCESDGANWKILNTTTTVS